MMNPFGMNEIQEDFVETQNFSDSHDFNQVQSGISENLENSIDSITDSESDIEEGNEELNDYIEDCDDLSQIKPSSYIQREDGTFQHKANAINSYLNNKTKASTDRILRVRKRIGNNEEDLNNCLSNDENLLALNDRLIT